MGKKSKRKNNNKPPPCCYHGCTKKEFNNYGEYYKVVESYDKVNTQEERIEFIRINTQFMVAPTFGNFVIAHVTSDYLKGKDTAINLRRLVLLVDIRYSFIPQDEGKDVGLESEYTKNRQKYIRDIHTERGRINCMAREIPCNCMEEKRKEAKSMEKVAMCYCCRKEFSKEKILRCKGCDHNQYCSKECSITHWPEHKEWCKRISVLSASAPTPGSFSSFEESTDVDAGEV